MILTVNNDPSERLTPDHVRLLAECDDARAYTECGWFCLLGWKSSNRIVHAHANSAEDFHRLAARQGYAWTGSGLVRLSAEERHRAMAPYGYRGDGPRRKERGA